MTARKPLIDNRLRSVLFSMGVCIALMAAYYISVGQDNIPPDTEITYQGCVATPCHAIRLKVVADGSVSLSNGTGAYRYHISTFALRRVLRVFKRQRFLDRDVAAYNAAGSEACVLGLHLDHRLTALTHACATQAPEIAKPLAALETATRFREIAAGDPTIIHDLSVERVN